MNTMTLAGCCCTRWPLVLCLTTAFALGTPPAEAQTSLKCGQVAAGEVSQARETDRFTFTASQGDTVLITVLTTQTADAGFDARGDLVSPGGASVSTSLSGRNLIGPLRENGTYTLGVRDSTSTRRGSYVVGIEWISPVPRQCDTTPLACGRPVDGTITAVAEHDLFTFTAGPGDLISVALLTHQGADNRFDARAELYAPSGALVQSYLAARDVIGPLKESGTYALLVRDYASTRLGAYTLALGWISPLASQCQTTPLECGNIRSGSIEAAAEQDLFTFTAGAHDTVAITLLTGRAADPGFEARAELIAPSGEPVSRYLSGRNVVGPLAEAGTYTLLLRDYASSRRGDYVIGLEWITPLDRQCESAALTCGQPVADSIDTPAELDLYSFSARQGDALSVTVVTGPNPDTRFEAQAELFSPGGERVAGYLSGRNVVGPLKETGTYTLAVHDNDSTRRGEYTVGLETIGPAAQQCDATALPCGQPHIGAIESPAEEDLFIFTARSGDQVAISLLTGQRADPRFEAYAELYAPSGEPVSRSLSNRQVIGPLKEGGTYTLLVHDYSSSSRGAYLVWLDCLEPRIRSISPSIGGNSGVVTATILTANFSLPDSATARLVQSGHPDIVGEPVDLAEDGSTVIASFDLTGKAPGSYDVVVTHPNGKSATLPNGFRIEQGGRPQIWVDILGRDTIRTGREHSFTIVYGNRGTVDALGVPLWITGIPKEATLKLGFSITPPPLQPGQPPLNWEGAPASIETGTDVMLPLFLPIVPAGQSGSLTFFLSVPDDRRFTLRAYANPPYIQYAAGPSTGGPRIQAQLTPGLILEVMDCVLSAVSELLNVAGLIPTAACPTQALRIFIEGVYYSTIRIGISDYGKSGKLETTFSWMQLLGDFVVFAASCIQSEVPGWGKVYQWFKVVDGARDVYQNCGPVAEKLSEAAREVQSVQSIDPNLKVGSRGVGEPHYLAGQEPLRYVILFENMAKATAPAQEVVITDQLDTAHLDLDTFTLGPMLFGSRQVTPPPGVSEFTADVDLRPARKLLVRIDARLNKSTGRVTWRFTAIDPDTGRLPEDPLAGFLPPNRVPPEGDGSVLFTVRPKQGIPNGTEIRNRATIIFDTNPPIGTPEWLNTVDSRAPSSHVLPLAPTQPAAGFEVRWAGSDGESGIRDFTLYVSDNGGPFVPWLSQTTQSSALFSGVLGHEYAFYSVARDNVGNQELPPAQPDARTQAPAVPDGAAPSGATLLISLPGSPPSAADPITVSPGQCLTLRLIVDFPAIPPIDVTFEPTTSFFTEVGHGTFEARNVWCARPEDTGKTISLIGRYRGRWGQTIQDTVTVHVGGSPTGS